MELLSPGLYVTYKRAGETPLEAINRIRGESPDFAAEKMAYAGRLDPLAEGLLLVLTGEECKNKEKYLGFDKEYEAEFLIGFGTDTGDVLGLPQGPHLDTEYPSNEIAEGIKSLMGKRVQSYPKYSSPIIAGRAEYSKEIEVYEAELAGIKEQTSSALLQEISRKISSVKGNFRQKEILSAWRAALHKQKRYQIVKCRIACSSGTYVRVLAEEFGKLLDTEACVFSLRRTRVGDWMLR